MSNTKILCLTKHNGRQFYVSSKYIVSFTRLPTSEIRQSKPITELKLTQETVYVIETPSEMLFLLGTISESEFHDRQSKEILEEETQGKLVSAAM